jgi:hypothetical protein
MYTNDFTSFRPVSSATIAASTTSARAALPISSDALSGSRSQVRLLHVLGDTVLAYIRFGDSTVTATTADLPIGNRFPEIFTIPDGATHVAVILSSGTGNFHVTSGFGGT